MKKRIFSRVLALVMALSLLSTTAFAASFTDLQEAINGTVAADGAANTANGTLIDEASGRYGYAWNAATEEGGQGRWGIEAWNTTNDDGTSIRNVQLKEDVEFDKTGEDASRMGDHSDVYEHDADEKAGIDIKKGQNVVIDLNGNSIDLNPGAVLDAATGTIYEAERNTETGAKIAKTDEEGNKVKAEDSDLIKDSVIEIAAGGKLTLTDTSSDKVEEQGAITGGKSGYKHTSGTNRPALVGGGVKVYGTFVMNGGNIAGNSNNQRGAGVQVNGEFDLYNGSIHDNYASPQGGGVEVLNGTFNMYGGTIANNTARDSGGGVGMMNANAKFNMSGGTITGNNALSTANSTGRGGAVQITSGSFKMTGGSITLNTAHKGGGVAVENGSFIMEGGSITGNKAEYRSSSSRDAGSGGGVININGIFKLTGGTIQGNIAERAGDDIYLRSGVKNKTTLYDLSTLVDAEGNKVILKDADGHSLNGWYHDEATSRWSENTVGTKYSELTRDLGLKLAHNKYYEITLDLNDGTDTPATTLVHTEMGQGFDTVTLEDPSRVGHTFVGWEVSENAKGLNDLASTDGENVTIKALWKINSYTATFTDPDGGNEFDSAEAEYNNPFTAPETPTREGYTFGGWALPDGTPYDFNTPATDDVTLVAVWNPVGGNDGDGGDTIIPDADLPLGDLPTGGADAATTTIEDEETPLAGLFTRADAIGYLWEQTGSPEADLSDFEDVPEDHYWAVAIGWAQDMGIALPDEDGNFRPDDLVLRTSDEPEGELQEFLNRYAVFAGVELEDGELFIELDGTAEDFIMGEEAQVIFDEFFAKLEAALAAQAA